MAASTSVPGPSTRWTSPPAPIRTDSPTATAWIGPTGAGGGGSGTVVRGGGGAVVVGAAVVVVATVVVVVLVVVVGASVVVVVASEVVGDTKKTGVAALGRTDADAMPT